MRVITILLFLIASPAMASTLPEATPGEAASSRPFEGILSNGFRYRIEPDRGRKGQIGFYFQVDVGSDDELPDTLEYPHLVEHMVFMGDPEKSTRGSIFEQVGRLTATPGRGSEVSAYTSPRSTNYNIKIGKSDAESVAAALDIVQRWSAGIGISEEELVRARAAIAEESRNAGGSVALEKQNRLIGIDIRSVTTADIQRSLSDAALSELKSFFESWYTPERMTLTVVGDVDPQEMARLIESRFASLERCSNEQPLQRAPVHPDGQVHVKLFDELSETDFLVSIRHRRSAFGAGSGEKGRSRTIAELIDGMVQSRLTYASDHDTPDRFLTIAMTDKMPGQLIDTAISFPARASNFESRVVDVVRLISHLRHSGFDKDEFEAALRKSPTALGAKTSPRITLAEVNQAARRWLSAPTRYIIVGRPRDKSLDALTEAEVAAIVAKAEQMPARGWEKSRPLPALEVSAPLTGPLVISHIENGVTELRYPGVDLTVLLRPDPASERILFHAERHGGAARAAGEDIQAARMAAEAFAASGLANLDSSDLDLWQRKTDVMMSPFIDAWREGLYGASGPEGLEPLFMMARAMMVREPLSVAEWEAWKIRLANIRNLNGERGLFEMKVRDVLAVTPVSDAAIIDPSRLTADAVSAAYRRHLGSPQNLVVAITGPFDPAAAASLAGRYLATLPKGTSVSYTPQPPAYLDGPLRVIIDDGMPGEALVRYHLTGRRDGPLPSVRATDGFRAILSARMFKRLREDELGVYSVQTSAAILRDTGEHLISIAYSCAPENVDRLLAATSDEISRAAREGFSDEEKLAMRRPSEEGLTARMLVEQYLRKREQPFVTRKPELEGNAALAAFRTYLDPSTAKIVIQLPKED